jgi:nanoRNase/pAp phosphatase (c-di-AMP/oligoRNAs hydrolase)
MTGLPAVVDGTNPGATDPAVVAGAALAVLVVFAGGWRVLAWLRRPAGVRLRETLADHDGVAVLTHPNPDPDAMSSALAAKFLAESVDTPASVHFPGSIQHQENRAFTTVLDVEMDQIETAAELPTENVVLVDHNEPRGFPGAEGIDPVAVVDHHPGDGTGSAFTDVRPETGACASLFADYLEAVDATVLAPGDDADDDLAVPSELATGLVYGVLSDTADLTKGATTTEFDACEYLASGIDEDLLDRIANPEVDEEVLDTKARAILERSVDPPFAVSDVGDLSNADAIPQSADELITLEGITAVVVYGEVEDTVHLSGRSRDDRVHMGRALESVVEDIPMASAGGHARMGGGQVPVDHMHGIGPSEGLTLAEFEQRLFAAMRGDR